MDGIAASYSTGNVCGPLILVKLSLRHNPLIDDVSDRTRVHVAFRKLDRTLLSNFQGDDKDETAKKAYMAFFFVSYYNRDTSAEYDRFQARVKNISKERFDFDYNEGEVVRKTSRSIFFIFLEFLFYSKQKYIHIQYRNTSCKVTKQTNENQKTTKKKRKKKRKKEKKPSPTRSRPHPS
jgi:hypothetical protein